MINSIMMAHDGKPDKNCLHLSEHDHTAENYPFRGIAK